MEARLQKLIEGYMHELAPRLEAGAAGSATPAMSPTVAAPPTQVLEAEEAAAEEKAVGECGSTVG